jgi:hypothetical protein
MNHFDQATPLLILDKTKSRGGDNSILNMIFFTIMIALSNYITKQLSYIIDDFDWKTNLEYYMTTKPNSIEFEGKITCGTGFYCGELKQTSVFSERFKAIWEHIVSTTNNNRTIYSIKEHKFDNKNDVGIYMVNQKDRFLISEEHQIFAYTYMKDEMTASGEKSDRPSNKISNIVIRLYSYKSSIEIIKTFVDNITHNYLSNLEMSRKTKRFIYTLTSVKWDETTCERWDETVFESTRTFDNLFFDNKDKVIDKIKHFLDNKEWYYRVGIPYSLGIGIHGPPGTGKTSFIKALANFTNRHIVCISLKLIKTKKQLDSIFFETRYNMSNDKAGIPFDKKIIVFEDIDCIGDIVIDRQFHKGKGLSEAKSSYKGNSSFPFNPIQNNVSATNHLLTTSNNTPSNNTPLTTSNNLLSPIDEPITLDDLLNLWDGIRETPGRILIISSNHYDILDPAIKRPGRIDIDLQLSFASHASIQAIYFLLFNNIIPNHILNSFPNMKLTPAHVINSLLKETKVSF